MSDHDETAGNSGYSTPVPELDDHRPRRGTFESSHGHQFVHQNDLFTTTRVRDFEEAIADDEGSEATSPIARRSRRPTVESMIDPRSVSPPNSVKAFAEARRQREMSISEQRPDRKVEDQDQQLQRTASVTSARPSFRSRAHTAQTARTEDVRSLASDDQPDAEDDVCFPLQDDRTDDLLHIDFAYLESFIDADKEARRVRKQSTMRVFSDLRPGSSCSTNQPYQIATADGDILNLPTSDSHVRNEKVGLEEPEEVHKPAPQHSADKNRVTFFSSNCETTVHAADLDGLTLPGENIRDLFQFPKRETDGVWWLNISEPTADEVSHICRAFGIHPLTIEDITTKEAREKIELFPSYYFACFRSFLCTRDDVTKEKEFEPFNYYVVVFREGALSFSYASNTHASRVIKRIAMLKDYLSLSSDWICYALIDDIVDCFAPAISQIEQETDQIEDEVFIARTDDMAGFLRRIGTARKNVMGLMRLLGGKADVLKGFTKRCNENYKVTPRMDIGLYLGDIQDHVVTMMTNLGHFEKMLSRSHSNYLAQLSIDSITQGTSTNKVLSKITLIASIIVPLNVVTGLFGMNVRVPWMDVGNTNAFFGIMGSLVAFCILTFLLARKLKLV